MFWLVSSVAVVLFALAAQPLSAQTAVAMEPASAAPAVTAEVAPAPALATEEAARVGINRADARVEAAVPAAAQQPADPALRWALIIGIAVIAALLIVALAD